MFYLGALMSKKKCIRDRLRTISVTLLFISCLLSTGSAISQSSSSIFTSNGNSDDNYFGPVKNTDDLWQIAIEYRPNNSVTIEKTAVAIFKLNSRAFAHRNLNGLMTGYFLQIPTLEQVGAIKEQQALDLIHTDNQQWKQLNTQQGTTAPKIATELVQQQTEQKALNSQKAVQSENSEAIKDAKQIIAAQPKPSFSSSSPTKDDNADYSTSGKASDSNNYPASSTTESPFAPKPSSAQTALEAPAQDSLEQNNSELTTNNENLKSEVSELQQLNSKLNSMVRQQDAVIEKVNQQGHDKELKNSSFGSFLNKTHLDNSFVKSLAKYQQWLIIIALIIVIIILVLIRARLVKRRRIARAENAPSSLCPEMLKEFSGDNVYDTQLDLATAYIALKRYDEAIPLLQSVISTGEPEQVTYAQSLMDALEQKKSE